MFSDSFFVIVCVKLVFLLDLDDAIQVIEWHVTFTFVWCTVEPFQDVRLIPRLGHCWAFFEYNIWLLSLSKVLKGFCDFFFF